MKQKKTFSRQGDAPSRRPAVQKGSAIPRSEAIAPRGEFAVSAAALNGESAALAAWWAKYAPVENAIVSAQERRRRRAKARHRDRARAITGPWERLGNPCEGVNPANGLGPERTWGGQSNYILKVSEDRYVAMFDIWRPDNQVDSRLVWLPVVFGDGEITIRWQDSL